MCLNNTTTEITLNDFQRGDMVCLSSLARQTPGLEKIHYARVVTVGEDALFLFNDLHKKHLAAPLSFISHKVPFDA